MFALNNDPEVLKFTGDLPFSSVQEASDFIHEYDHYQRHGFGRWTIIDKTNYSYIGWCGLKLNEENDIDLGFRILKQHWNKGYATEAAKASIQWGFSNLQIESIIGRAIKDNRASIAVLKKVGMTFWKNGSCHGLPNAQYYRILKG